MRAVLGIDRAWTSKNPSGVALLCEEGGRWVCRLLASSYGECPGQPKDEMALLARIHADHQCRPDVVAIDMPLSTMPIIGRREADAAVSQAFGKYQCGTHSPSITRPGPIAEQVRSTFEASGYELQTNRSRLRKGMNALIEVYPHPALVRLAMSSARLQYKVGKTKKYWPNERQERRRELVGEVLEEILQMLRVCKIEFDLAIPRSGTLSSLKAFEDKVDALVCAWVGVEHLGKRTEPFGDATAAIWIPQEGIDYCNANLSPKPKARMLANA